MPVVALPFKAFGASLATSWNSIRNYSRVWLLNRSNRGDIDEYNMTYNPSYKEAEYHLPQVVKGDGAITGLRSFMRRAYRSTAAINTQRTASLTCVEATSSASFTSVDEVHDYHGQLKNIHLVQNGGRDNCFESQPVPRPPLPVALQYDNLWQQNQPKY